MLTFTVMPAFGGLARLPSAGEARRLYAFGTPASPGGIVVSAVRLREHMQVVASFDETTVPMEAVQRALASLTDPRSVLDRSLTHTASSSSTGSLEPGGEREPRPRPVSHPG